MFRMHLAALFVVALIAAGPATASPGPASLLSVSSGTSGGNGSPRPLDANGREAITPDGRYVAFVDDSSNLTPTADANGDYDVFRRDTQTGQTTLVSIDAAGDAAGNSDSGQPAISDDGRYVAFQSFADNLVSGYSGATAQIYVRDMQTGTTKLVSAAAGSQTTAGNGINIYPVMTGDGRYVVWDTKASNMETPDILGGGALPGYQIAVRDLQAQTTKFVTVDPTGTALGNKGYGFYYSITPDGRYVAWESGDTNLVQGFVDPGGLSTRTWVYRRDLQTGTTVLASPSASNAAMGATAKSGDNAVLISDDGRYVTFDGNATDLVAGFADNNGSFGDDVFQRDVTAGTTTLVSGPSATASGEEQSLLPQASADGRYVMFLTDANDLVAGDTNNNPDLVRWDRTTGIRVVVDRDSGSGPPAGGGNGVDQLGGVLSADGNHAAFASDATGMITGQSGAGEQVYFRDIGAATTVMISAIPATAAHGGNQDSHNVWMSADGTHVTWSSKATDLIAGFGDLNGSAEDLFVRPTGVAPPAPADTGGATGGDDPPAASDANGGGPPISNPIATTDSPTGATNPTGATPPTGSVPPQHKPKKKKHKKHKKHRRHHKKRHKARRHRSRPR